MKKCKTCEEYKEDGMFRWIDGKSTDLCKTCNPKNRIFSKDKRAIYMRGYTNNKLKRNNQQRFRREILKCKVLSHYGGKCVCCGETEISFLTIDHINGGGNAERKMGIYAGNQYNWIIKNNYPETYQILCANCNMSKHINGNCGHNSIK